MLSIGAIWSRVAAAAFSLMLVMTVQAPAQHLRFESYAEDAGLGNIDLYTLVQTGAGFLLAGTASGLYRFDGTSFSALDAGVGLPPGLFIHELEVDGRDRVWAATDEGLFVQEGATFRLVATQAAKATFTAGHRLTVSPTDLTASIEGRLFATKIGKNGPGVLQPVFSSARLAALPALRSVGFVMRESPHDLLIGCGTGLCEIAGQHVQTIGPAEGLPPDTWQAGLHASDGTLWVRSLDRLAWRGAGEQRFHTIAVPGTHFGYDAHPDMLSLVVDKQGALLTPSDQGLLTWNGRDWHLDRSRDGGMPAVVIGAMIFDREGSLWLGTVGDGAARSIGYGVWENWDSSDGLINNTVWAITRAKGALWIGTAQGAGPIDQANAENVRIGGNNYVTAATRDGMIWLAPTGSDLVRVRPDGDRQEHFAHIATPQAAVVDHADRLWIATLDGLLLVPDADADAVKIETRMSGKAFEDLTVDPHGGLWFLVADGLYRLSKTDRLELVVPARSMAGEPRVISAGPDGTIWVGTSTAGILRFSVEAGQPLKLTSITHPQIGSNDILSLARDHRGWVWVGTDRGIDMFDGHSWQHFERDSGPISDDMNQGAIFEDRDGSMWFGTSHGLSHLLHPDRLAKPGKLHPIITKAMLGGRPLDLSDRIRSAWTTKPLVVDFSALDFAHGRSIDYLYRLRGVDMDWNQTSAHEVSYARVPAGKRDFEVIAIDAVHGEKSDAVGFTIEIRAPWWRRWWFYLLCAGVGPAGVGAAWNFRLKLLLRQRQLLEALVRERTAEIENARRELLRQATTDALTGLANRRAIMASLEEAVSTSIRLRSPFAILLIDIDHFKTINDHHGHLAGDTVLEEFGSRLRTAIKPPQAVGRYGGEEFLILLTGRDCETSERAGVIRACLITAPYAFGGTEQVVTVSGGIAWLRADDTALTLIGRADAALYVAKGKGRNRIEMERSPTGRSPAEANLLTAAQD